MESKCDTQEKFKQLQKFIDSMEDRRGALIAVLHKAQHLYGYLSNDVIFYIAE
ncbi:MAG: NAD(P)H-dependent oxidoreductase subunit E, partial [Paenibacillaceae bacterium]|nr:NAD(P)H-dependent oxidoreductase subunit E [Paenibacillaceae bacterium]